jgi:hypothetical protein
MSNKRFEAAIAIDNGACNPSGIALSIAEACREIRNNGRYNGTVDLTGDPAIRLMVHQLAYICGIPTLMEMNEYTELVDLCKRSEAYPRLVYDKQEETTHG